MILPLILLMPMIAFGADLPPTPFPVFLRAGYSTILEFEECPSRVVLGDAQAFQIEKLDKSLVIKTLTPYATTNMFVYFKNISARLFVLTASEDAQPTYYKKFETPNPIKLPGASSGTPKSLTRGSRIRNVHFDAKKDYLTVETEISADSSEIVRPNWSLVRLKQGSRTLAPFKLWSERKEIQKDSVVRSRFVFVKPNVGRSLDGVILVIPLSGDNKTISLPLKGGRS